MLMQLLQLRKMLALASLLMSFGPRFQKRNWKTWLGEGTFLLVGDVSVVLEEHAKPADRSDFLEKD